jgi:hypothetical protein
MSDHILSKSAYTAVINAKSIERKTLAKHTD